MEISIRCSENIALDDVSSFGEEYFYNGTEADSCLALNSNDDLSVEKCNSVKISDKKYKCCFLSFKEDNKDNNFCMPLIESKVEDYIKDFEENFGDDVDISFDCSSNYLSKALIILLSLII